MEEIRFFLPGPTYVLQEVREELIKQPIGHRSREFRQLYERISNKLPKVFKTKNRVYTVTGSASLLMELAIRSFVNNRVLSLISGAFGARWHDIAVSCDKEADTLEVPWGSFIDPDDLRNKLRSTKYDAVTVVHSETSTATLNPIKEIAKVVREESGALIIVDAVSSLGGVELRVDDWFLDVVITGSQKALALPPGLSFITASPRALRRAASIRNRGFYTDILRYVKKDSELGTPTTPAVSLFFALDKQLDLILREGLENRWKRHVDLKNRIEKWVKKTEFSLVSNYPSPTVSAISTEDIVSPGELVSRLANLGFVVGSGYGKWKNLTFRIGHMGEVRSDDLERLLSTIEQLIGEVKTHG